MPARHGPAQGWIGRRAPARRPVRPLPHGRAHPSTERAMAERKQDEESTPKQGEVWADPARDTSREEAAGSGPTIRGRSFAGTNIANDERQQTADHRGDSDNTRLDDAV